MPVGEGVVGEPGQQGDAACLAARPALAQHGLLTWFMDAAPKAEADRLLLPFKCPAGENPRKSGHVRLRVA
jgi:hypothetical protein